MQRQRILQAASLIFVATTLLRAEDKKLKRQQLPTAVSAAVDRETQGAQILGYASEKEHGKVFYEVETSVSGHSRDLQFTSDGTLTEVEEEVAMDTLAPQVKAGLLANAHGAQIQKVESLTKAGRLVAYEASTLKNGKKGEVQVNPEGGKLLHEE